MLITLGLMWLARSLRGRIVGPRLPGTPAPLAQPRRAGQVARGEYLHFLACSILSNPGVTHYITRDFTRESVRTVVREAPRVISGLMPTVPRRPRPLLPLPASVPLFEGRQELRGALDDPHATVRHLIHETGGDERRER